MTEPETYIAYLETRCELKAIRIAELEAALTIALKNLDSAVMVQRVDGVQVAKAAKVLAKGIPASSLTAKYIREYYG